MTGTAQGVKYHVSDFLQDRHPYNVEQSYTAQRARDAGKVFNGLLPNGLDKLLDALDDDEIEPVQKAVSLRHLHAHSAAPEKKIILLRKDVVPRLVRLLRNSATGLIEQLGMQIFRSLCVLPQGCHCVIAQGGVEAIAATLANRDDLEDRDEARTSAASAVALIAGSWNGRAWLLGIPCPPDLQLQDYDLPEITPEQSGKLSQHLCDVLVSCVEQDAASPQTVAHCLGSISQLSLERVGLQRCLVSGALRAISTALERFARDDMWVYGESFVEMESVLHGATAVWHLALDDVGKKEAAELPFIQHVGRLVAFVVPVKTKLLSVKAALAGAICALTTHTPLKQEAIAPLTNLGGESASLLDLVLRLLAQANELYDPIYAAQKEGRPNPMPGIKLEHVAGVVKNCVQAVRLIVELPAARQVLLDQLMGDDATYKLRRQLFYQTPHQQTFGVLPV